jgi:hypothetical protein
MVLLELVEDTSVEGTRIPRSDDFRLPRNVTLLEPLALPSRRHEAQETELSAPPKLDSLGPKNGRLSAPPKMSFSWTPPVEDRTVDRDTSVEETRVQRASSKRVEFPLPPKDGSLGILRRETGSTVDTSVEETRTPRTANFRSPQNVILLDSVEHTSVEETRVQESRHSAHTKRRFSWTQERTTFAHTKRRFSWTPSRRHETG